MNKCSNSHILQNKSILQILTLNKILGEPRPPAPRPPVSRPLIVHQNIYNNTDFRKIFQILEFTFSISLRALTYHSSTDKQTLTCAIAYGGRVPSPSDCVVWTFNTRCFFSFVLVVP